MWEWMLNSQWLAEYGLFLVKTVTLVVAVVVGFGSLVSVILSAKSEPETGGKGRIKVKALHEKYNKTQKNMRMSTTTEMNQELLAKQNKLEAKQQAKADKKMQKEKTKQLKKLHKSKDNKLKDKKPRDENHASNKADKADKTDKSLAALIDSTKKRNFVLSFSGDVQASAVTELRQMISAVLSVATPEDEVIIRLESPGGVVHGYGLAASQLKRIKNKGIPLTVCVDKVAASGGYMMACIADKIIAAPFAIIGSIGVVAQIPNFHKVLKKNDVDYELFTAGDFKRTVTMFGENTEQGKQKFQSELEETHELFKHFVSENRPVVTIDDVATGEHWFATQAKAKHLVDEISTSDEYIESKITADPEGEDVFAVYFEEKQPLIKRLGIGASDALYGAVERLIKRDQLPKF